MKQVININFQGRVVPIEVTAFDILKNYTESLNRHFANEQGKEEIINDIESRIGELFQEKLKSGATCITEEDVNNIIKNMGRPEDFDTTGDESQAGQNKESGSHTSMGGAGYAKKLYRDENDKVLGGVCSGLGNYFGIDSVILRIIFVIMFFSGIGFLAYIILWAVVPSSAVSEIGSYRKKLYRDTDNKLIAGVCSGLSKYFGVPIWIPRLLFLIPFLSFAFKWGHWGGLSFPDFLSFSFSPGSFLVYIILWLVLPEATTTAEKLEMKGEKVDMNSIKNSVVEEMKGVKERAEKLSKEAAGIAREKSKVMGAEFSGAVKRNRNPIGNIVAGFFKIIFYIIFGSIAIGLVFALFGLAIAAIGVFPIKDFVFNGALQNWLAWGTLIFFIAVPIVGVITWIIRRLTRVRSGNKNLAFGFSILWLLGWVCFIMLLANVSKDFRRTNNPAEQFITLANPHVSRMDITADDPDKTFFRTNWSRFDLYEALDSDTVYVRNVVFKIEKSETDSFRVSIMRIARGQSRTAADTTARNIQYNVIQKDSTLLIDKGIAITKQEKFRNQYVIVRIYVPVGKQINIDRSVGRWNDATIGFYDDDDWNFETKKTQRNWDYNTNYIMKEDGIYTLDGIKAGTSNDKSWNDEDVYDGKTKVQIDENGIRIETEKGNPGKTDAELYQLDSLQKELKNKKKNIEDSIHKLNEKKQQVKEVLRQKGVGDDVTGATAFHTLLIPVYNPLM
ncbi:MAG: PspC domain-containing protein [Bacteroidetes bacterium]|nr:PspC domain-containing protein [Bacteroidota bacterium]MBS1925942.1 PspC domain-containing protein [Bacteroidota bacterium]